MAEYNFTYATTFVPDYLVPYLSKKDYITGIKTKDNKYITVTTDRELSSTELSDLNSYIEDYTDFNQTVVDSSVIDACKAWGRKKLNEIETKNMDRKRNGEMGRIELFRIMEETHNSFIYMPLLEGALDTLHGILFGFPEETVSDTTTPAVSPYTFSYIWEEDITTLKNDLTDFLGSL